MNLGELVRVALMSVKGSKMRSLLTTLGIMIGIAAVISVVAIGQGGRAALNTEMEKFGTNVFVVYLDGEVRLGDMKMVDLQVIKAAVPEVKNLAPVRDLNAKVRGPRGEIDMNIEGTTYEMAAIRNIELRTGRFLNEEDQASSRRVIVLDEDSARSLFGNANPVGEQVSMAGNTAMVVGVTRKNQSQFGDNAKTGYIPISFTSGIEGDEIFFMMWGGATQKDKVDEAMNGTIKVLERRHQAPKHYKGESMEGQMRQINEVTSIISLIISSIAGISLLVGGIGVMNIMLVSVTERTREIGIRMALGARRRDILVQFLVEAIVLCLMGGILGTMIGYGGAFLVAHYAKWPPLVSWGTIGLAFGFATAIGLVFGVYPANRAARLDPIEALRRD
ncbi:MAG TPA: ABC transporter permease [Syntrophomonadaceae bacterium]|nr:ABC transporter permease [Syntrophomonadaceae bacterium]